MKNVRVIKNTIVHFSADIWEHFCPVQRVVEPAQRVGFQVLRGNDWDQKSGHLKIYPERVSEADLVIIQRDFPRHFEAYEEIIARARSLHKPVLYEWDDLLTELPVEHPDYDRYMSVRTAVLTAVIEADAVTCATPFLADYTRQFNPDVWVLPNYLNDRFWHLRPLPSDISEQHPITIGYLGAHSHKPDLAMIVPVLERLLNSYGERLRLQLWNITPPESLAGLPNVEIPWPGLVNYEEFVVFFLQQACDIVIAPLLESEFNRGKSWQKFLEYSALGVPGVYSRVTPYEMVVEQNKNGFLVQSLSEWESCLRALIEDASLRQRMGQVAQETVRKDWMLSELVQRWDDVYSRVVSLPPDVHRSINPVARKFFTWEQEVILRGQQTRQELENTLVEKDSIIRTRQELENILVEKDSTIQTLYLTLSEHKRTNRKLSYSIKELERINRTLQLQIVDERDRDIIDFRQKIEEKDNTIRAIQGNLYETSKALNGILSSPGWMMLERLYRIRLFLAPRGSTREKLLYLMIKSVHAMRTTGFVGFLRKAYTRLRSRPEPAPQVLPPTPNLLSFEVTAGRPCPFPAISLVIDTAQPSLRVTPEALQDWARRQTIDSYEIILWDRDITTARSLISPFREWQAASVPELCQGLTGRYVCMASAELLQQSSIYLEENLMTLEGEQLAFTMNLAGKIHRDIQRLQKSKKPGSEDQPLAHMIVRLDCIGKDFTLDISVRMTNRDSNPILIGKILRHTSDLPDGGGAFPMVGSLAGFDTRLEGVYLLARRHSDLPWQSITHTFCSIDGLFPEWENPSDLPTVLMVLPFLAVGGAEQLALHVISGLKDRVRFVVLTSDEIDSSLGNLSDAFRQQTPWVYNLRDFLHPALAYSFLVYLIKTLDPVCLYIANGSPWIYDVLPEIKHQYPDLRTVNQVYDSREGWINRYDIPLLLALDGHIGANRKICQAYMDKGSKPEQVYLVEHGIDPSGLNPDTYTNDHKNAIKQKLGLPEGGKIVAFASRLHPQKRPMDFVELARRFSDDVSVSFLMMGDGPLAGEVDKQITKIGLKNFYRRGFYRPIGDILAISDVIVLPSEYEGMPMIIAEAQLMGKPVVVTDVGNNREVLEITGGGVVIPQIGDVTALMSSVRVMLDRPPSSTKMRDLYLANFGIQIIAQKYYQALLGGSGA
jgi:glycosyltransferase involved in cell wall biosynthesis